MFGGLEGLCGFALWGMGEGGQWVGKARGGVFSGMGGGGGLEKGRERGVRDWSEDTR